MASPNTLLLQAAVCSGVSWDTDDGAEGEQSSLNPGDAVAHLQGWAMVSTAVSTSNTTLRC